MKVTLINNNNGDIKEVKLGFSWTTLFWGGLVPLIRKDWIAAIILIVVNIVLSACTYGFGNIFFDIAVAAFYNKNYIQRLIKDNYHPNGETEEMKLRKYNINF